MTHPDVGPALTSSLPPSHAVLEQAAHWYAVLRDGKAGAQDKTAWQDWLHADDTHQTAWRYVENIGRNFTPLRGQADARLAADALGQATRYRHTRRRILASAALVTGGTLLGYLGWRDTLLPAALMALGADHRTGVGEQRQISLADGSQVWLNTASAINVKIDDHARTVTLVDGEIFITTAKDALRPFFVQTAYGRMRALGTQFTVRSQADRTLLAVYEGAVELRIPSAGGVRVLRAGQQVRFSATDIFATETADTAREAWTQGVLIADNIPLRQVVDELRRYRRGHLGVADDVAEFTVYGNFPIQDSERVLRMLTSVLPVRIAQPLPWWTSIEARR
jgi:transmembrane sensor